MNVRQAAESIGVSPQHIRWLIRAGRIRAKQQTSRHNQYGYEYLISAAEVRRYGQSDRRRGPKSAK